MMCCATPLDWLRERGSCATTLPNTVWLKPPHLTLHCMSELDKEEKSNLALRKKQEKATQRVNKPEFDWIMITEKFSFALESLNVSKSLWFVLNISNGMCYTMLCMLEWMRKEKHRIGTLWTRGLRGSALTAYIHGGIP